MRREPLHIEAVIFDYDGTLFYLNIDFRAMRGGVEKLLRHYGIEPTDLDGLLILEMIDEAARRISEKDLESGSSFYQRAIEFVTEFEVAAVAAGSILPGVTSTLTKLKEQGIKVAIVTRNCEKAVKMGFPAIKDFCDAFLPRDSVKRVKPHPMHLTLALKELGIQDPACCLVVGDHVLDVTGGRQLGMKTAGVLTGKTTTQDFAAAGADFILDDATKILDLIFQV